MSTEECSHCGRMVHDDHIHTVMGVEYCCHCAPAWTSEPPTKPGKYWNRYVQGGRAMKPMISEFDGEYWFHQMYVAALDVPVRREFWPIAIPEPPTGEEKED